MTLDCSLPDYSKLCGGVDNRSCGELQIEPPVVFELTCGDLTITDVVVFIIGESCAVAPFPAWALHTGTTNILSSGTVRTLNLSLINPTYIGTPPTAGEYQKDFEPETGDVCSTLVTGSEGSTLTSVLVDDVPLDPSDYTYDPVTTEIVFTPCLVSPLNITINYEIPGTSPTFSNELIANITGSSCLPSTMLYFNNASNPDIPLGATLIIDTLGNIKWTGSPTSFDMSGAVIEVENIIYNV